VLAVAGGGGRGCDVDHVQLQQDKREWTALIVPLGLVSAVPDC